YADSWSSTRMETIFHHVLQLLLADPEATPLDIQVLFADPTLRQQRLAQLIDNDRLSHAVRNFWQNFEALSPSEQRSQVQPVLNRLNVFLGSPVVERLTCHPQTLDFRALIRERKIVLVRLSGDTIFNAVDTLGAIFLV